MKILHILDIPWWSAISSYAFDSIEAHIQLGHKVQCAAPNGTLPYKKGAEKGWDMIPIGSRSSFHFLKNLFKILRSQDSHPQIIVAHTGSAHSLGTLLAKIWNIPILRVRATSQTFNSNFLTRSLYQRTDSIITVSENLKGKILHSIPELKEKIFTMYPCVEETRENWGGLGTVPLGTVPSPPPKIGLLARLDRVKGHTYFLKAAKIVQETIPEAQFHFAGPEENIFWADLEREIKDLNLKNCFYHGFLKEEEVFPWMRSCTLGVISSVASEELSRAALEWMAVGLPIVATNVGSIPELIIHNENGFLCQPKNSRSMAEAMIQILKSKELLQKFSQNNLKRSQEHFSKEKFKSEWEKILEISVVL